MGDGDKELEVQGRLQQAVTPDAIMRLGTAYWGSKTLLSAVELKQCPACRKPVRKIISAFNTPSLTKPTSISDAKKAGFTVLKRVSKGEYERQ